MFETSPVNLERKTMLRLVIRKVLSFSAVVTCAFALLMLDTDSPSLLPEAAACEPQVYEQCFWQCGFACAAYGIPNCRPDQGCDCNSYCVAYCLDYAGCS